MRTVRTRLQTGELEDVEHRVLKSGWVRFLSAFWPNRNRNRSSLHSNFGPTETGLLAVGFGWFLCRSQLVPTSLNRNTVPTGWDQLRPVATGWDPTTTT